MFFVFSLGQLARIDILPSIAVTGLDMAVIGCVLLWGLWLVVKKEVVISPTWKSFVLFLSIAAVSLLFNAFFIPQGQLFAAFLYLLRFAMYVMLFFLVFSFASKKKAVVYQVMAITGFFMVVIGYVQFVFYPALRNLYYGGWDEHFYRMFGTFLDPNFLGLFFVLYTLFLLFLFFRSNNKTIKGVYGVLTVMTVVAVFLTYSRSALMTLLIGVTTFLLLKGHKKIVLLFVCLILLGGVLTFFITGKRSEGTNFFRVVSTEARFGNMKDALTVWQDNIVLGVGFNAYRYAQHRHGIYKAGWEEGHGSAGADNSFLFVLATTGVIGLTAFLYFLYQHIRVLRKQKNRLYTSLGIATLVSISVGSFFINGLFYPSLMVWLWIVLGLTENI